MITDCRTLSQVPGQLRMFDRHQEWVFKIFLILSSVFKKFSDKIFYCCVSLIHAVSAAPLNGSHVNTCINYTLVATDITLAWSINIYPMVIYSICVNRNKSSWLILNRHSADVVAGISLTLGEWMWQSATDNKFIYIICLM